MKRELVLCGECEYLDAASREYPWQTQRGRCRLGPEQPMKYGGDGCYSGCKRSDAKFDGVLKNHPNYSETTNGRQAG